MCFECVVARPFTLNDRCWFGHEHFSSLLITVKKFCTCLMLICKFCIVVYRRLSLLHTLCVPKYQFLRNVCTRTFFCTIKIKCEQMKICSTSWYFHIKMIWFYMVTWYFHLHDNVSYNSTMIIRSTEFENVSHLG